MRATDDLRIASIKAVTPPTEICEEIPITEAAAETTWQTRQAIGNLLDGTDDRLMVVAGPCSIHDVDAAREYAGRLKPLIDKFRDDLLIVMRVYFEKPRTTVGWKGLINDPDLDDSFHINKGVRLARRLLLDLNEMGVPAGTEFLDIITPQYVTDLVSWGAIGARTTESQVHRELASGLSCPVGFKNGTDGSVKIAVDAIRAASVPHNFLSMRKEGNSAIYITTGNSACHVILRGGKRPNFDRWSIDSTAAELTGAGLPARIMVDFSHANSQETAQESTAGRRRRLQPGPGWRRQDFRRDDRKPPAGGPPGRKARAGTGIRPEHHRRLPGLGRLRGLDRRAGSSLRGAPRADRLTGTRPATAAGTVGIKEALT